ncbi:MAG TPA: SpoIID/LytB domain-containing protein [Blastocatellia bacterium]|nr:SpoIID/LytB domain-containing protein [Blastocatellia bacterium]
MTNIIATMALLLITSPAAYAAQTVRIGLFSLFKPEVLDVRIASGEGAALDVSGLSGNRSLAHGESVRIRLSANRLNIRKAGSYDGAGQSEFAAAVRIVPIGSSTLELVLPGRMKRIVRGALTVEVEGGGRGHLRIALTTDREAAVASVVAAETSKRELEALKALAIVVRTYMLSQTGRHSTEGFDFCDTTHCQVYRGEQDLSDTSSSVAVTRAVTATAGQFLSFEGAPVEGHYTAACGGMSATPSLVWGGHEKYPYRRIACRWCEASRFARWERSAGAADVLAALSRVVGATLSDDTELIPDSDPAGLVRSVKLRNGSRRSVLTADAFRRAIGSRLGWNTVLSPTFTIERRGSKFIFRGRGFGSQVGLCEAGAFAQAAMGRTCGEILTFYYPLAEISEVAND